MHHIMPCEIAICYAYSTCFMPSRRRFVFSFIGYCDVATVTYSGQTVSILNLFVRESRSVLIHQLSKRLTQRIPFKTKGIPVSTTFHPTRSIFFTATKKDVRVYDLLKQKLVKKLDAGVREISSIAVHPGGMSLSLCHALGEHIDASKLLFWPI